MMRSPTNATICPTKRLNPKGSKLRGVLLCAVLALLVRGTEASDEKVNDDGPTDVDPHEPANVPGWESYDPEPEPAAHVDTDEPANVTGWESYDPEYAIGDYQEPQPAAYLDEMQNKLSEKITKVKMEIDQQIKFRKILQEDLSLKRTFKLKKEKFNIISSVEETIRNLQDDLKLYENEREITERKNVAARLQESERKLRETQEENNKLRELESKRLIALRPNAWRRAVFSMGPIGDEDDVTISHDEKTADCSGMAQLLAGQPVPKNGTASITVKIDRLAAGAAPSDLRILVRAKTEKRNLNCTWCYWADGRVVLTDRRPVWGFPNVVTDHHRSPEEIKPSTSDPEEVMATGLPSLRVGNELTVSLVPGPGGRGQLTFTHAGRRSLRDRLRFPRYLRQGYAVPRGFTTSVRGDDIISLEVIMFTDSKVTLV